MESSLFRDFGSVGSNVMFRIEREGAHGLSTDKQIGNDSVRMRVSSSSFRSKIQSDEERSGKLQPNSRETLTDDFRVRTKS